MACVWERALRATGRLIAQPGHALQNRHTDFLGAAGIHGGLVDHRVAGFQDAADGLAGYDERGQVGALGGVDRGGHGDDIDVALGNVGQLMAETELRGLSQ